MRTHLSMTLLITQIIVSENNIQYRNDDFRNIVLYIRNNYILL